MNSDNSRIAVKSQKSSLSGKLLQKNLQAAKRTFGWPLERRLISHLRTLTRDYEFFVEAGELQIINNSWYVTHTGLLRLARRKHCRGSRSSR